MVKSSDPRNVLGHAAAEGHEDRDASIHPIVLTGGALALSLIIVGLIVYGVFRYLATHQPQPGAPNPMAETSQQQIPPEPRVEEHPQLELQELRAREDRILSTYGWMDKQKGIVRIPIDRAMELELQRGFPVLKQANPAGNATGKESRQ